MKKNQITVSLTYGTQAQKERERDCIDDVLKTLIQIV